MRVTLQEKRQGILQIPRAVTKSLDAVEVTLKMPLASRIHHE